MSAKEVKFAQDARERRSRTLEGCGSFVLTNLLALLAKQWHLDDCKPV
jgi:hypothetical protein